VYQKVIIIGNLGRDPELRYTPQGVPVVNFSVATNERWTDQEGQQQDRTTWFRVTAWRKTAENCAQYLTKGRSVLVEGALNPDPQTGGPRVWTGNDGVPRASYEMRALRVKFLPGRGVGAPEGAEPLEEEEIPF